MINGYPYTDLHELNADWLLKKTAELEARVKELEDGGVGHVSIEPTLTGGVKIADYEIGETPGELYAPESVTNITPTYNNGLEIAEFSRGGVTGKIYVPTDILPEVDGAGYHNSINRGQYLGDSVTADQYAQITAGTFKDMFIGDYWTIPTVINGVTKNIDYIIAGFDYWWNIGDSFPQGDNKHHVVLVPRTSLYNARMNASAVTTGAYLGSEMYTNNLTEARTAIGNAFSGHLYSVRTMLPNAVSSGGQASGWDWATCSVELLGETMVCGCRVWGNTAYDVGGNGGVLPLFSIDHSAKFTREGWWLYNTVNTAAFSFISSRGDISYLTATNGTPGVRPWFSIYGGN